MPLSPVQYTAVLLSVASLSLPIARAADLEQRVELLERRVQALSEQALRVDGLQREVQQLRGELELQSHAMEALKTRQRDLYLDIDSRLNGGSPGTDETPAPTGRPPGDASPPSPVESPGSSFSVPQATEATAAEERDYQKAFELLTQRRYDEAREAFTRFLGKYPEGLYADNAQYWLGEASYVTRDFDVALDEFSKVLKRYPESSKVPGAMLKIGYIQYDQQRSKLARQTLDTLIQRYPDSSAARLAQEFIRKKNI